MMRVVVTGATGTIGRAVVAALQARGDQVVALTRDPEKARSLLSGVEIHAWVSTTLEPPPQAALRGADAIVHLLGEPIAQRWTEPAKREIRDSRVLSTRLLVDALRTRPPGAGPLTLVAQSATGYYGSQGDAWLSEDAPAGNDFLAGVVVAWERESLAATALEHVRVIVARTGVVLSRQGGALSKMLFPFRMGVGGPIAGGRQYLPWVHIDDVVGALLHCVDDGAANGPINVVAPNPVTNAEMSVALGRVLHRPALMPVPGFALRALYGEMAVTVTGGQRVSAEKLEALGYVFRHPSFEPAVRAVLAAAA